MIYIRRLRITQALLLGGIAISLLLASRTAITADISSSQSVTESMAVSKPTWFLRLPLDERVTYQGKANFDNAGNSSFNMLYPAPNAGGLLAAVITHGILNESTKKTQKEQIQADADKVLLGYKAILENFSNLELMKLALQFHPLGDSAKLVDSSSEQKDGLLIESKPVFSIAPDHRAIVLDNEIIIHRSSNTHENVYRNTVTIVASSNNVIDPQKHWITNSGKELKTESARLVAKSLDIAVRDSDASKDSEIPFRTVRYREGNIDKFERAQILDAQCGRLLIRTLRGSLMSVPVSNTALQSSVSDKCNPASITQLGATTGKP